MRMLYDSEDFVVVHADAHGVDGVNSHNAFKPARDTYEIVDKRVNKSVLLDGPFAIVFKRQMDNWQVNVPSQDEVEEVLDTYSRLAQLPLVIH